VSTKVEPLAKGERVLLVSASACENEKHLLTDNGLDVVKSNSGEDAIFRAKHATFDLAVLVSTGKTMDMAETVFNLRDAHPAMPIIILTAVVGSEEAAMIAEACPNARSLTSENLAAYIVTHDSH
jgi:DNA-binding response OmpR family regulator